MKNWILIISTLFFTAPVFAQTFDDTVFFVPPFHLSGIDNELPDLLGKTQSNLCGPIALTHAFEYLKRYRQPNFPQLRQIADMDKDGEIDTFKDRVRYFYTTCKTDKDAGTRYSLLTQCTDDFIKLSPYRSWTYMIGPHARTAPPGNTVEDLQKALSVTSIKYFLKNQAAVIMGIGWFKFDPQSRKYVRTGGHFFNLYGYGYVNDWGANRLDLFVVNSWVNYSTRPAGKVFDHIILSSLAAYQPETLPSDVSFELQGTGFNFPDYKAFVEDIFVAYPY